MKLETGYRSRDEERESRQLAEAIRLQQVDLSVELGDEFFPAHVTVALIDAVLTSQLDYESHVVPRVKEYCNCFGLQRVRADKNRFPPENDQETLTSLIEHFDNEDMTALLGKFKQNSKLKTEIIRCAALALREIGIETLQSVVESGPKSIKCALRPVFGIGDAVIHMFLMYTGREDFVKGDKHVCRFVENALCRSKIDPRGAETLVKHAAAKLGVAPRLLDYAIWRYGAKSVRAA